MFGAGKGDRPPVYPEILETELNRPGLLNAIKAEEKNTVKALENELQKGLSEP